MQPILSIVATSRNDNHGENLLQRMQAFLDGLAIQSNRFRLATELILVEWNPPVERSRLQEALSIPRSSDFFVCRIITVPADIHSRFQYSQQLPLFQMIAKNAGIRRAAAPFILATNIDILFSNELFRFLSSTKLKKGVLYRVDRYDAPLPQGTSLDEKLEYCSKHMIRINCEEGTRNLVTGQYHTVYPPQFFSGRLREKLQDLGLLPVRNYTRLHTNACGDFTLMAKEHWFDIRGYAEFEMYSFYIDALLCHAAYHSGARQLILKDPCRIYHMEHAPGSGWSPEAHEKLKERLEKIEVPQLQHRELSEWAIRMRKEKKPILFSQENWGLADHQLPETQIA